MHNPYLDYDDLYTDSVYFFFIAEKTMAEFSWEDIVNKQLFEKRKSLSIKDYNELHRVVTLSPIDK